MTTNLISDDTSTERENCALTVYYVIFPFVSSMALFSFRQK